MKPNGILTALVTFYDENGNLDTVELRRHVKRLKDVGVNGFFACGTTGEGALLTSDEKHRVISAVVAEVGSSATVIAAVIQPDTRGAVEEVTLYAGLGIDYVAVVSPYYIKVDVAEMIAHFTTIADESPVPILAYDIPGNTGNPLTEDIYEAILLHEKIVGVKDSSGNFSNFSRRVIAAANSGNRGIQWIQGEDTLDAAAMMVGADGLVSGLSNVFPEPFVRMVTAAHDGDIVTILAMQQVINTLHGIVRRTGKGVAPIRLALSQQGYGSRYLRSRAMSLGKEWDGLIQSDVRAARELYNSL